MENGDVLILEGIESEVDPILDPVLEKQIIRKGGNTKAADNKDGGATIVNPRVKLFITIGGTLIDYNPKFKIFLTCKLGNPKFSPELSAKTTIIDFTVT